MSAVPTTDAPALESHYTEWRLLTEQPCNVLFEGSVPATDAFVRLLLPHVREPIVEHRPPATLNLPAGETGALIVRDAAALSRDDQRRLSAWMGDAGSGAQIITTASCALFPLVEAGVFDAALYYRLNVLLLRVSSPFQSGLLREDLEGAPRHNSPIAISTSPCLYDRTCTMPDEKPAREDRVRALRHVRDLPLNPSRV